MPWLGNIKRSWQESPRVVPASTHYRWWSSIISSPFQSFGNNGQVSLDPESLFDPKLTQSSWEVTTHYDIEDCLVLVKLKYSWDPHLLAYLSRRRELRLQMVWSPLSTATIFFILGKLLRWLGELRILYRLRTNKRISNGYWGIQELQVMEFHWGLRWLVSLLYTLL